MEIAPEGGVDIGAGQIAAPLFHAQTRDCTMRHLVRPGQQRFVTIQTGAQAVQITQPASAPEQSRAIESGLFGRQQGQGLAVETTLALPADGKDCLAQHFQHFEALARRHSKGIEG